MLVMELIMFNTAKNNSFFSHDDILLNNHDLHLVDDSDID